MINCYLSSVNLKVLNKRLTKGSRDRMVIDLDGKNNMFYWSIGDFLDIQILM